LTGYDRANADFWLENLLYPSREIREGFGAYLARSKGGQVFSGLLDGQDAAGVVLKDMAGNRTTLRKDELQSLEALPVSLMPEGLLAGMSDADLRDLFAYLMRR
jgi:putative heme-binding domain-containing protein